MYVFQSFRLRFWLQLPVETFIFIVDPEKWECERMSKRLWDNYSSIFYDKIHWHFIFAVKRICSGAFSFFFESKNNLLGFVKGLGSDDFASDFPRAMAHSPQMSFFLGRGASMWVLRRVISSHLQLMPSSTKYIIKKSRLLWMLTTYCNGIFANWHFRHVSVCFGL